MSLRSVGTVDRVARVVLGLAVFALYLLLLYLVLEWRLHWFSAVGAIRF